MGGCAGLVAASTILHLKYRPTLQAGRQDGSGAAHLARHAQRCQIVRRARLAGLAKALRHLQRHQAADAVAHNHLG